MKQKLVNAGHVMRGSGYWFLTGSLSGRKEEVNTEGHGQMTLCVDAEENIW